MGLEINLWASSRLWNPLEFLSRKGRKAFWVGTISFLVLFCLVALGVAFILIPLCDPLFLFKVIIVFFIFDFSLFFPDPHSMVSGDAIIVPRAFKESTLEKGERETETAR